MAEEIDVGNGRNSNFEGLVTLTFDPAIPHTVVHHSSTCTYIPNFMEMGRKKILKVNTEFKFKSPALSSCSSHRPLPMYQLSFKLKKLFVDGRTYGRADGHFFPLYY